MAKLTDPQKTFIVVRLACFYTASDVQQQLKQELGLDASLQQICAYDPTTVNGERMSQALKDLFHDTRKRFLENVQAIPIANQSYRLRRLQDIIDNPSYRKNPTVVAPLLEQAAKEIGGLYTNRREVTGKDGGAQVHRHTVISADDLKKLPPDELIQLHRDTLGLSE